MCAILPPWHRLVDAGALGVVAPDEATCRTTVYSISEKE